MRQLVSDAAIVELIETIYAAGCDPAEWANVGAIIQRVVPGSGFGIMLGLDGTIVHTQSVLLGFDPDLIASYVAHYWRINPFEAVHAKAPVGKVYTMGSVASPDWVKRHDFYHEWLKPAGDWTHGACVVVNKSERGRMRVNIDLPDRLGPLEQASAHLLERLVPHFARAFALNDKLRAVATTQDILEGILERINGAAAIMDSDARVVAINARGEALVRAATVAKITTAGQFVFRHPDNNANFRRALASATGADAADGNSPSGFAAKGARTAEVSVLVLPLRPRAGGFARIGSRVLALLVLSEAASSTRPPKEILRSIFGLTHAEAVIVMQIAAGVSISTAADCSTISRTTARNQLAAAMAKMGAHRQAELVALVAALVPRLTLDR